LDCEFAGWWIADLRICLVTGGIIPNFLLPLAFRKFILFGCKGELSVRRKILFGLRPVFLLSAFVTPLRLPKRVQNLRAGKPTFRTYRNFRFLAESRFVVALAAHP